MLKKLTSYSTFWVIPFCAFLLVLIVAAVKFINIGSKDTAGVLFNSCMSSGQVSINKVVFQCKPVGIKLDITLPSGTDTVMYKKFQEASNEAQ